MMTQPEASIGRDGECDLGRPTVDITYTNLGPVSATPHYVVEGALDILGLSADDVVYDIGCNDGRVLIRAVQHKGVRRAVGIEVDDKAFQRAKAQVAEAGLEGQVELRHEDAMKSDISDATVVFTYLLASGMQAVREKLRAELAPGARVVSFLFKMPGWEELLEATETLFNSAKSRNTTGDICRVFVYRML